MYACVPAPNPDEAVRQMEAISIVRHATDGDITTPLWYPSGTPLVPLWSKQRSHRLYISAVRKERGGEKGAREEGGDADKEGRVVVGVVGVVL